MEYGPDLHADTPSQPSPRGRRQHYRQRISTLAYVNLDLTNGAIIRDLSQAGVAIQAVTPVQANQQVHLRFDLTRPRAHIEAVGRVAWADSRGQAGVEFLDLPERPRRSLKEWIFTQLLARGERLAGTGSIFVVPEAEKDAEEANELHFSSSPRPSIRLAPVEDAVLSSFDVESLEQETVRLRDLTLAISPLVLARVMDTLIVIAAVLLFCALAVIMTGVLPGWPLTLLLLLAAGLFGLVYWILFAVWLGDTPGAKFARKHSPEEIEEDLPRFR